MIFCCLEEISSLLHLDEQPAIVHCLLYNFQSQSLHKSTNLQMDFCFAPPPLSTVWYDPICAANHCINFSQIALPDMINNSFSYSKLYCWCLSIGHSLKNWVSSFPGFLHWTSKQWFWRRTTHCGNYSLIDVQRLRVAISGSLTFIASPNGSKKTNSLFSALSCSVTLVQWLPNGIR